MAHVRIGESGDTGMGLLGTWGEITAANKWLVQTLGLFPLELMDALGFSLDQESMQITQKWKSGSGEV